MGLIVNFSKWDGAKWAKIGSVTWREADDTLIFEGEPAVLGIEKMPVLEVPDVEAEPITIDDPEEFVRALPLSYKSAYLMASTVKEIDN